jgi:hypothetical protein
MKSESCPATTEVCFQSRAQARGLQRTMPKSPVIESTGNPPAKSKLHNGGSFAPASVGPKISMPISLCRSVAPKLVWEVPYGVGCCVVREIEVVGTSHIAESVHQHNARKPGAILARGFDFGLVLLVDLRAQQLRGFFQLLHAASKVGGGGDRLLIRPNGRRWV